MAEKQPDQDEARINPWGVLAWSLTVMTWLCGVPAAAHLWGLAG